MRQSFEISYRKKKKNEFVYFDYIATEIPNKSLQRLNHRFRDNVIVPTHMEEKCLKDFEMITEEDP